MQGNANSGKPLQVIQFTDTHFFAHGDGKLLGVDTAASFQMVLNAAEKQGTPDLYLLTGDLSQDETEGSYKRFASAIENFQAPTYFLPGNHDSRELMQRGFADTNAPLNADVHFSKGRWHFVLLDTQVPNEVGGKLSASELERLDEQLEQNKDKFAIIAMHHHALSVGSSWMDQIKVENADQFLAVIDKHAHVRVVLNGHIHQEFEANRKGVSFIGTPSTCVQFAPNSQGFGVHAVPPGYRWINLFDDGTVETAVVRAATVAPGLDLASAGY